ncbi:hypothetical protein HMPREF1548_04966 [Clostridium sp. KLE 1755]|nr:hypothetical protein HMPREF1548_04966 [Clostridium sp. KLE 1755]
MSRRPFLSNFIYEIFILLSLVFFRCPCYYFFVYNSIFIPAVLPTVLTHLFYWKGRDAFVLIYLIFVYILLCFPYL